MAYLIRDDHQKNPATGLPERRYRIGEKVGGKQTTGQIGYASDMGADPEREARRQLTIYEGRRAAGESPDAIWGRLEPVTPPPSGRTTLAVVYDRHALSLAADGKAEATRDSAGFSWRAWAPLAELPVVEVTRTRVDGVVAGWREAQLSDRTIQLRVRLLRALLIRAHSDGDLRAMPDVRPPPVRVTKPHRWLTPNEQQLLLAALPWAPLPWTRTKAGAEGGSSGAPGSAMAIYLGLQLGLRTGEALSRRWSDVAWSPASLQIGAAETKTRTGRVLPLAAPVVAKFKERYMAAGREDGAFLCEGITDYDRALYAACRRAGVPQVSAHGLRHSWASRLAMAGVDRQTLMQLGGWTSGEMLDEIYSHVHAPHVREQVERTAL